MIVYGIIWVAGILVTLGSVVTLWLMERRPSVFRRLGLKRGHRAQSRVLSVLTVALSVVLVSLVALSIHSAIDHNLIQI